MKAIIRETFKKGQGILRLMPTLIPRYLGQPGYRLCLHPDDYYAFGIKRGPIKERWFSSVIPANNGPLAQPDEGLSYVSVSDDPNDRFLFCDAVEELGAEIIGEELQDKYGNWPMFAKFFDYKTPIFHHLHLDDAAAGRVGRIGKPEAYYYPKELNNHPGDFPLSYFGFAPDVTKEQVKERILSFEQDDTRMTELSRAFRIELGTGWYTPPGVVHAPGSYLTYEPQWNSDINAVFENVVDGETFGREFLVEFVPENKKNDIDYIMSLIDWEKNVDPNYRGKYFRPPIPCPVESESYKEQWVIYANDYIGAKELRIQPGCTAVVKDAVAYGCIIIQGHGRFGPYDAEAAGVFRFGQVSADEYFVSESAAKEGVTVVNNSHYQPIVILKHFGPNHPEMPRTVV